MDHPSRSLTGHQANVKSHNTPLGTGSGFLRFLRIKGCGEKAPLRVQGLAAERVSASKETVNQKGAGSDKRKTKVRAMNNTSLTSADSHTHLKVVVVSLIAGILVIGVGIAASPSFNQGGATATRMEATGPVIRAGKPMAVTAGDTATIR